MGAPRHLAALDLDAIRDHLAVWYHLRRRSLPWREDPTPYRVWVSEVMLQQTRVATVIPYFERFVAAFPDAGALAAAPEEEVLSRWAGLGYYRRCRSLHAAAKVVVEEHGGEVPCDLEALRALPGVGRYTAGAIASIAFGIPAALLDGNVARVLSRLLALELPVDGAEGQARLWETAEALLDRRDPSSHNQALMELGALVCTPRAAACADCPVEPECRARRSGDPESFPVKKPRRAPALARAVGGLVTDGGDRVLLARRPSDGLLGGLWELPGGDVDAGCPSETALAGHLSRRLGLDTRIGPRIASIEHVFTHRRLTLEVYGVEGLDGDPSPTWYTDCRFLPADRLGSVPLSRLTEKVLAALGYPLG